MKKLLFIVLALAPMLAWAGEWKARWIGSELENGGANTWMAFRKVVDVGNVPASLEAKIATDTKYWLWVNGEMIVRDGGLKRGPAPGDGYFDVVDIAPYLKPGKNVIAVLVDHFGKAGFSHMPSGSVSLLFEASGDGVEIVSDKSWEVFRQKAYTLVPDEAPNFRLPESNVRFDARLYDDSWLTTTEKMGRHAIVMPFEPGSAPMGRLVRRPVPFWKDYGVKEYEKTERRGDTLVCTLPYNAHFSPILRVSSPGGKVIRLRTDHDYVGGSACVVGEYVTRDGVQEYEHLPWMNGQYMYYIIPEGVSVESVAYRETGYDCGFAGSFHCDDELLNEYWEKAVRTLYVCMRDTYMDCPDRERAQWWGDEVHELTEAFYALGRSSDALALKGIRELCSWAASDGVLYAPVPCSNYFRELPQQILASVGWYGFREFAFYGGDSSFYAGVYPAVHRYLHDVWRLDSNGLPVQRDGGWSWADAGKNIDIDGLLVPWYYLALKAEREYAIALGLADDASEDSSLMERMAASFDRLFWTGTDYRSPGFEGPADDRLQAMAVVSGLASPDKYPALAAVFDGSAFAYPYMFRFVLEALYRMGLPDKAIERMHRFFPTAMSPDYSTLWEHWNRRGSSNHAWTGCGIVIFMEEICGIKPLEPGFREFSVEPQMGSLKAVDASFESACGVISLSLRRKCRTIDAVISVPDGATAVVRDRRGRTLRLAPGSHRLTLAQ